MGQGRERGAERERRERGREKESEKERERERDGGRKREYADTHVFCMSTLFYASEKFYWSIPITGKNI